MIDALLELVSTFPADAVPDGATLAPHHYTSGVVVTVVSASYAWDRFTDREPATLAFGAVMGLFFFITVWRYYPVAGAIGTLLSTAVATVGLARFRAYTGRPAFWLTAVGLIMMWDDALEHAFGIWTPLDWVWHAYLVPIIA